MLELVLYRRCAGAGDTLRILRALVNSFVYILYIV